MLLFAGISVLQMIPNFVLVLSSMRSIISKKTNFEKMTYRMVLAVCGSYIMCAENQMCYSRRHQSVVEDHSRTDLDVLCA